MKTILVPTDFSRNADKALEYAVSLAKKSKGQIILLHVYNMVYISADAPPDLLAEELTAIEKASEASLNKLCEKVYALHKLKCIAINRQGIVIDGILDTIKRKKVSMVVMGTKGASGIKAALIGSNATKLISKCPVPLIAVPEKSALNGMKNIVFATDYHNSDISTIKQLVEITALFKAKLTVVHVAGTEYTIEDEKEYFSKFMLKLKKKVSYKLLAQELLYAYDVEKKLEQYVRKNGVDLLAVTTRSRNFMERFFGTSITKKLAYHSVVPLLVFRYKKDFDKTGT